MDEARARRLVEGLEKGSGVRWELREVMPIELLLPPGVEVVEAIPASGAPVAPAAFGIVAGHEPAALHEAEGLRRFLLAAGRLLEPLAKVLVVVRYRLPTLLDAPSVELETRGLSVADGVVTFTTQAGARRDRWALDGATGELTATDVRA